MARTLAPEHAGAGPTLAPVVPLPSRTRPRAVSVLFTQVRSYLRTEPAAEDPTGPGPLERGPIERGPIERAIRHHPSNATGLRLDSAAPGTRVPDDAA